LPSATPLQRALRVNGKRLERCHIRPQGGLLQGPFEVGRNAERYPVGARLAREWEMVERCRIRPRGGLQQDPGLADMPAYFVGTVAFQIVGVIR
jgi:hypothetical protein